MFPLKDDNPTTRTPILTILLILVNVFVFFLEATVPSEARETIITTYALIPARLASGEPSAIAGLFTSQFLHGGLLHVGSNMLYLWIFGNNIEDQLGRWRLLPFYLGCGAAAGLAQMLADPSSTIPTIGASGAVAGILGAYALLFPRARVYTVVLVFVFLRIIPVPAALWLGIWFLLQAGSAVVTRGSAGAGGVAWWAHLGGFAIGFLLIWLLRPRRRRPPDAMFEGAPWMR